MCPVNNHLDYRDHVIFFRPYCRLKDKRVKELDKTLELKYNLDLN